MRERFEERPALFYGNDQYLSVVQVPRTLSWDALGEFDAFYCTCGVACSAWGGAWRVSSAGRLLFDDTR
jgi:hypothetical protein